MDRRLFSTNFYVYKYYSPELDVYYIGSHHCHGKISHICTHTVCNYKSSSVEVTRLKEERPHATWEMFILGWAQDEDTLRAMELSWIRRHIRDPKCLNKVVSSPRRRLPETGRRHSVEMIDPRGVLQRPRAEHFLELIAAGWRSTNKGNVNIRNETLRFECVIWLPTLYKNIKRVIKTEWTYGGCCSYERIGASRFLETLRMIDCVEELDAESAPSELEKVEIVEDLQVKQTFFLQTY